MSLEKGTELKFDASKHVSFVYSYFDESCQPTRYFEKVSMSHIKMNVLYWATCTLSLLDRVTLSDLQMNIYLYVESCWHEQIGIFYF